MLDSPADRWLKFRPSLVLLLVNVIGDIVQFGLRNPDLANRSSPQCYALVKHVGAASTQRIARIELVTPDPSRPQEAPPTVAVPQVPNYRPGPSTIEPEPAFQPRPAQPSPNLPTNVNAAARHMPLLEASVRWVRSVLRSAVANFPVSPGDTPGYSVTRDTLLQSLDQPAAITITGLTSRISTARSRQPPNPTSRWPGISRTRPRSRRIPRVSPGTGA